MVTSAAKFLEKAKEAIGEGEYQWGAAHGTLKTDRIYQTMDCSSFASWVLGNLFNQKAVNAKTTVELIKNPYDLNEVSKQDIKSHLNNMPQGMVVQFVYVGEGKGRHTGFFFKDESGKVQVMDFRGGRNDKLVCEDASKMLNLCLKKSNVKFFVVDKSGNNVNFASAENALDGAFRENPSMFGGFNGLKGFLQNLFSGGIYKMLLDAHKEQQIEKLSSIGDRSNVVDDCDELKRNHLQHGLSGEYESSKESATKDGNIPLPPVDTTPVAFTKKGYWRNAGLKDFE